ncbi:MAG TPA: diguanylate cyclase [Candidatus Gastranaerophilales bacterium]|nr:diguanylate cyclase [Candidatus Gastranaerophilales bacterium]
MIKKIWDKKLFRQISYFLFIALSILFIWFIGQKVFNFGQLLEAYELKTYDLRATMAAKSRVINPNIVIVSIDDDSLEILQDELGRWPWSREVYSETIHYLEKENVDSVAFDLMFVGNQKGFEDKDLELAKTIGKYDNVYTSMNFDYREDNDKAPELPEKFKINLENKSKNIDFSEFSFTYCRLILDEIIEATQNVGFINFMRDPIDKISRRSPTFFKYKDDYYPYLALKVATDYIKRQEKLKIDKYVINEKNELIIGNRSFPLDENGSIIINWYGSHYTYNYIPFWKVYKSALSLKKGEPPLIAKNFFKDKIAFLGVTAVSLYDIKSTPLSSIYPGVEIQATVLNNILDNKSIQRADKFVDIGISFLLSFLIALVVIKIREPVISSFISIAIVLGYIFWASYLLEHYLLWVGIISQIVFMTATFTAMYIIKYVLKSKDFEYTYKLATTDGLTGLYNHRYFQEKLKENMKKADKNNSNFSLVLIDIDFFKKFNDTYGHQAGDEVLRQVGYTLKKTVKPSDVVARYGGEEMVIILPDADTNSAIIIANRVCKAIAEEKFKLNEGITVNVTISLGIATYSVHGKTSTELVEFADKGLYSAKANGRNQVGQLPDNSNAVMSH